MKAKSTIAPAWPEEVRQLHDMLCMALALPAPDYAKAPRPIQHGVCRSCGQLVTDLGRDFYKQEEADWYATLQCQCPASIRQQAKERAFDNITEIFGDGAAHIAQEPINDTAIDVLCVIAAAVCDSRVERLPWR